MSPLFNGSLRYSLAAAAVLAAFAGLAALAGACLSSGGGNLGDPCMSATDCQNQYECLGIDDAGSCNPKTLTCQQACQSLANCQIVGANYTCTPIDCAGPGNTGICTAGPPSQ